MPLLSNQLERDIAAILGLDASQILEGSLAIEYDHRGRSTPVAQWKGALTLTDEQAVAVEARIEQEETSRRAARARHMLSNLPADERRRIIAELKDGPR